MVRPLTGTEHQKFENLLVWSGYHLKKRDWCQQSGAKTRNKYCDEMNSHFPKLRFCDLDWKSKQIATDNYPSWYATWTSKLKELKHENEKDIINKSAQSKHSCKASAQAALKWKKVESQTDVNDSMEVELGEATMESDVIIISANIPATTDNTQVSHHSIFFFE